MYRDWCSNNNIVLDTTGKRDPGPRDHSVLGELKWSTKRTRYRSRQGSKSPRTVYIRRVRNPEVMRTKLSYGRKNVNERHQRTVLVRQENERSPSAQLLLVYTKRRSPGRQTTVLDCVT
jgi:hypothetical protein